MKTRKALISKALRVLSVGAPGGIRTPDTLLKRQVLCLLSYWGMDNFKYINDIFGHQEGDALLKRFSTILGALESSGIVPARIGGDEFMTAFLPKVFTSIAYFTEAKQKCK